MGHTHDMGLTQCMRLLLSELQVVIANHESLNKDVPHHLDSRLVGKQVPASPITLTYERECTLRIQI